MADHLLMSHEIVHFPKSKAVEHPRHRERQLHFMFTLVRHHFKKVDSIACKDSFFAFFRPQIEQSICTLEVTCNLKAFSRNHTFLPLHGNRVCYCFVGSSFSNLKFKDFRFFMARHAHQYRFNFDLEYGK